MKIHYPRYKGCNTIKSLCGVVIENDGRSIGEMNDDFLGATLDSRCESCEKILRLQHTATVVDAWINSRGGELDRKHRAPDWRKK